MLAYYDIFFEIVIEIEKLTVKMFEIGMLSCFMSKASRIIMLSLKVIVTNYVPVLPKTVKNIK